MTILSSKYNYIYLKSHRTASTTIREYFKKHVEPDLKYNCGLPNHASAEEVRDYLFRKNKKHVWREYLKITSLYINCMDYFS